MKDIQSKLLVQVAILLTVVFIGWSIYDGAVREKTVGESSYHAANKFFEDRKYNEALNAYKKAVIQNPNLIHAQRGTARTLMQLGQNEKALIKFNEVINIEPEFGASYANRGILHDRMENYELAIADYKKALQLNPDLAKGPSWLTRFLRNQAEKPPSILDRLNYLLAEMEKPESQRVLKFPDKDKQQRSYKR